MVVDVEVVRRVVLVVALGLEDRHQVDGVDAQLFQVRQLLLQPVEIAAVEPVEHEVLVKRLPVLPFPRRRREPLAGPRPDGVRIVGGISVAEPVQHDLVPDRVLGPFGRLEYVWLRHGHSKDDGGAAVRPAVGECKCIVDLCRLVCGCGGRKVPGGEVRHRGLTLHNVRHSAGFARNPLGILDWDFGLDPNETRPKSSRFAQIRSDSSTEA